MGPGRLSISGEYPISNKEYSTSKGSKQKTKFRRANRATPWHATEEKPDAFHLEGGGPPPPKKTG